MLDQLRANKGGIITYVFLFAIIIVFVVSFGPGSFDKGCNASRGGPAWAAKVNGQEVAAADYEQSYANLLRNFQAQAGPSFSRELAEQLGLPGMAMNQVVERTVLLQEAKRQGLSVSDEELAKTIAAVPSFQVGGKFDKEGYQRAVAASYGTAERFERKVREDLLVQRLVSALRETIKVPEAEVKEAWLADHDRVSLRFVRFPLAAAEADVKRPSAAEAAAFAAKASARVEAAYKEGAARFDQPRKVRVRHILAKVAGTDDAGAKKKVEALAARLQKGEDFAKVAKEASEDDSTKDRGGDLGFVAEGLVEKPFADAAFALAAGKVSPPVRTSAGWHLIKVEEVVPAKKVSLEVARAVLAPELILKDRAAALAGEKAAAALQGLKGGKSLDGLFPADSAKDAKEKRVAVKLGGQALLPESTGPISGPGPFVPRIGAAPELLQAALAAGGPQVLGQVFQTAQGPVVAVVESRERPDQSKYQAERDAVVQRLTMEREAPAQQAWVKKLREAATVEVNPAATARAVPADQG